MRDILKENFLSVWNGTDKTNENKNGGVAIWTLPPNAYNAHNPAMFTRDKYLHVTTGYASPYEKKPCYVSIDNDKICLVFTEKTASDLYITADTDTGEVSVKVMKGVTEWAMSKYCTKILSVLSLSLSAAFKDFQPEDNTRIYLMPNEPYLGYLYICKDKDNIAYRNTAIDSCAFSLYFGDGTSVTLTVESFGGRTIFNAGEVAKTKFAKNLAEFGSEPLLLDPALALKHTVSAKVTTREFVAVNGVSQIGQRSARTGEDGNVLTTLSALSYYEGYPLDYSVIAAESNVQTSAGEAVKGGIYRVLVGDDNQRILQNESGNEVLVDTDKKVLLGFDMDARIRRRCVPDNPFYVRWLNRDGGVDYFMFGKTQKKTKSLKSVTTYAPFVEDTQSARTNRKIYSMEAEAGIKAGTSLLNKTDYEAIAAMPFSPLIEYYEEQLYKWIRVAVEKFDGETDTKGEMFSVEISFTLPNINTQY